MPARLLTLVTCATLLACKASLSVPAGAAVACTKDSQCPPGYLCRSAIGRCVAAADAALAGPTVLSATAVPLIGLAQELSVVVTLDRPMQIAPSVTWTQGSQALVLAAGPLQATAASYALVGTVPGDFVDGPTQLVVTAQDAFANVSTTIVAGPLIDATPPAAQSVGWFDAEGALFAKTLAGVADALVVHAIVSRDAKVQSAVIVADNGAVLADLTALVVSTPTNTALALSVPIDTRALGLAGVFTATTVFTLSDGAKNVAAVTSPALNFDLVRPALALTQSPPASTTAITASFAFSSLDADTIGFECALDGAAYAACVSPLTMNDLRVGMHHLDIRAHDGAGNTSPAVSATWTISRVWDRMIGGCAIASDGALYCSAGPVGDGTDNHPVTLERVPLPIRTRDFAEGGGGRCATGVDDSVWCWGGWPQGNLTHPVQMLGPGLCDKLAVGGEGQTASACALEHDGSIWCWGDNHNGALANGTYGEGADRIAPGLAGSASDHWREVAAGDGVYAIRDDGTLWGWGQQHGSIDGHTHLIDAATDWVGVISTYFGLCAIHGSGGVGTPSCIGPNDYGQIDLLGTVVNSFTTFGPYTDFAPPLAPTRFNTCGIRHVGSGSEAWCRGQNITGFLGTPLPSSPKDLVKVINRTDIKSLAANDIGVCVTTFSGDLLCWSQAFVDVSAPAPPPHMVSESLTWSTIEIANGICGVATDHDAYTWGAYNGGTFALTDAGTLSAPTRITNEHDWVSLSCGDSAACGLRGTQAYCLGSNAYGTLAQPLSMTSSTTGIAVDANNDWEQIEVGNSLACGIRTAGGAHQLYCWGAYYPSAAAATPKLVDASSWSSITVNVDKVCGIHSDGSLWCVPVDSSGVIGTPTQPLGVFTDWLSVRLNTTYSGLATLRNNGGLFTFDNTSNGFSEISPTTQKIGIALDGSLASGGSFGVSAPGPLHGLTATDYGGCAITPSGKRSCWGNAVGDGSAIHYAPVAILAEQTP